MDPAVWETHKSFESSLLLIIVIITDLTISHLFHLSILIFAVYDFFIHASQIPEKFKLICWIVP